MLDHLWQLLRKRTLAHGSDFAKLVLLSATFHYCVRAGAIIRRESKNHRKWGFFLLVTYYKL